MSDSAEPRPGAELHPAPRPGRSSWLLGRAATREKRLRLRRFLMSVGSYTMWFAFTVAAREAGLVAATRDTVWLAGAGMLASQTVFYALIRFDISSRFKDPSMTLAQILVALGWSLLLIALAREVRGLMLMVYLITLLFGIFGLGPRQFMLAAGTGFLGYVGLVAFEWLWRPGLFSVGYYLTSLAILGGVLLWTTLFGSYVSNLRYRLSARNQELEEALGRIRTLADRDELTGLYNRRYILQALRREKVRSDRSGGKLAVCIIDLDHFKQVNDRYGHGAGDEVLRRFAAYVEGQLREIDVIGSAARQARAFARYGGEEFILVLPDTDLEGARLCAERLRQAQQEHAATRTPGVTLSAGVAEYVPGEPVDTLLRRADQALYAAKTAGRNQVCVER